MLILTAEIYLEHLKIVEMIIILAPLDVNPEPVYTNQTCCPKVDRISKK